MNSYDLRMARIATIGAISDHFGWSPREGEVVIRVVANRFYPKRIKWREKFIEEAMELIYGNS